MKLVNLLSWVKFKTIDIRAIHSARSFAAVEILNTEILFSNNLANAY